MINKLRTPSFLEERNCQAQGYHRIAGIDEVGRGPLAGPVVAAAVILPGNIKAPWLCLVRDSKQLTPQRRDFLFQRINKAAVDIGIGKVESGAIDKIGIVPATRLAMKIAVNQLAPQPEFLLIDYVSLPKVGLPQKGIVKGDILCFSIACASIIAKVTRDRLMVDFDRYYPGYGFAQHKGYGTKQHCDCLRRLGPSPIHRYSFKPVCEMKVR